MQRNTRMIHLLSPLKHNYHRYILCIVLFSIFFSKITLGQEFGYQLRRPGAPEKILAVRGALGLNGMDFKYIEPLFPSPAGTNKLKPYFELGLQKEFKLLPNYVGIIELNYASRPGKIVSKLGEWEWKWQNSYVELPFYVKRYVSNEWNVYLGGNIGYLLSASITRNENSPLPFVNSTENLKSTYEPLIFSVILGGGYELNEDFSVDLRLFHGLSDVAKSTNPYNGAIYNAVSFSVIYNLPLGSKSSKYLRF